jgi:hypothetical protein
LTKRASSPSSLADATIVASTIVPVLIVIALALNCAGREEPAIQLLGDQPLAKAEQNRPRRRRIRSICAEGTSMRGA